MMNVPELLTRYELPVDLERYARRFTTLEGLWRFCERADWMLWMVHTLRPCEVGRLRLFTCKCARRWNRHLTDSRSVRAIEAAEKYMTGEVSRSALNFLRDGAKRAALEAQASQRPNDARAAFIAVLTLNDDVLEAAKAASKLSAAAEHAINGTNSYEHEQQILSEQADELRKLLGNPFADSAKATVSMTA